MSDDWLWDDDVDEGDCWYRYRVTVPPGEHLMTWIFTDDAPMVIWIDGIPIEFSDLDRRTPPEAP